MRRRMDPVLQGIPPAELRAAVALIRASLSTAERARLTATISEDPEDWAVAHHFSTGLDVRNLLRANGYGERWPYPADLDAVWPALLKLALLPDEDEDRPDRSSPP